MRSWCFGETATTNGGVLRIFAHTGFYPNLTCSQDFRLWNNYLIFVDLIKENKMCYRWPRVASKIWNKAAVKMHITLSCLLRVESLREKVVCSTCDCTKLCEVLSLGCNLAGKYHWAKAGLGRMVHSCAGKPPAAIQDSSFMLSNSIGPICNLSLNLDHWTQSPKRAPNDRWDVQLITGLEQLL